ncbi:hypothetical protein [Amycolatopsis aidingensis]|uniref:hypothetical protein n=1 Tax=Amycolatopsis aidingensis TaxID=2842453 RepID=UPI001C0B738E|nr:hypothetical protein [Amycolatopsis aidingensis]
MADEAVSGVGAGAAAAAVRQVWGQSFLDQVAAGASGSSGGGGFRFPSAEEIDSVIRKWEAEHETIIEDGEDIGYLLELATPPAKDQASTGYVETARASLKRLQEQNMSMRSYVETYIEKLLAAKRAHQGQEAESEAAFSRANSITDGL